MKRTAVIAHNRADVSPHLGQGLDDAVHGSFLYGIISCYSRVKGLSRQDSGHKSCSRAAVSGIESGVGLLKTM